MSEVKYICVELKDGVVTVNSWLYSKPQDVVDDMDTDAQVMLGEDRAGAGRIFADARALEKALETWEGEDRFYFEAPSGTQYSIHAVGVDQ